MSQYKIRNTKNPRTNTSGCQWAEPLTQFKNYLILERGLSDNTQKSYLRDLKLLTNFLKENDITDTPYDLSQEILQQFVYEQARVRNPTSQARLISSLKQFFGFLIFNKDREDNPTDLIEAPKTTRKLPDVLSIEEIDKLIAVIDKSEKNGHRNHAIIETLYGCGLRVSELVNLKLSDIFYEEELVLVTGKGNKQRWVPVAPITLAVIELYKNQIRVHQPTLTNESDILFLNNRGRRLTRAMIFHLIKVLADKSGIKKKIGPHTFRHSFATHLLENGANLSDIQQMLGHSSITTTEIYLHLDKKHLTKALEDFHPRGKKQLGG